VKIGNNVTLENGCYFKFDGIWKKGPSIIIGNDCFIGVNVEFNIKDNITIGDYTLIDSGSKFIDHDHGIDLKDLIKKQKCPTESIRIGNNVWIGDNVTILKGVVINDGAVIAAGAVVNKSINENEIWGGVPAKFIKIRL
jgi:acetyltransferase-like isoleucine patch superfamily enzyme